MTTQTLYLLQKIYAHGQIQQSRKTLAEVQKICQQIFKVAERQIPDFCQGKELRVFVEEVQNIYDAATEQLLAFDHSLQLQGVISCDAKSFAVINHRKLEIGDQIARFVVADIKDDKVLLVDGNVFIRLYTSPHNMDKVQLKQSVEKAWQYARFFTEESGNLFKIYTREYLIPHRYEKLFMVEHLLKVGIQADSLEVIQEVTARCEILNMMAEPLGAFGKKFTIAHKTRELCTTAKQTLQSMRKSREAKGKK